MENLSSSERARARARANHAKNDAQKGCAMQLNGITLKKNVVFCRRPNQAENCPYVLIVLQEIAICLGKNKEIFMI